ncbi:MAG TPA: hypothetical protein VK926_03320 [Gaiellaceae bacterium]|nr:hypothetical protein [Gaiellaceae bacterium]
MSVLTGWRPPGAVPPDVGRRLLGRRTRRFGVALFIAAVAVNAAIGIYAVLAPDFGDTQAKILGTSLCVTGAVLIALACEPAWERALLGPVPIGAAGLGAVGFALAVAVMWAGPESESWAKAAMTILTVAVAGVVASLLALARLAPHHAWIRRITFVLLAVGTVFYAALPWLEDPGEWFIRAFGVVMIALAAFLVTVPVVHWLDRGALAASEAATGAVRFCPYCGRGIAGETGADLACSRCGREFRVAQAVTRTADPSST